MLKNLKSKKQLAREAKKQLENGGYRCTWDIIRFTDFYDKKDDGTINEIMKLYDSDDDSIRLSFTYHIGGNFYTEYIYNAEDVSDIKQLLECGARIYNEKVSKYTFTLQPCWND